MSVAVKQRQRRKGQVVIPTEPMFLTVTGLPANRSPFRIVRSDKVDELKSNDRIKIERADHIVSIELPEGLNAEEVSNYAAVYGLDDEMFKQSTVGNATVFTRRSDAGIDKSTLTVVTMPKGEKVTIARSDPDSTVAATKEVDAIVDAGLPADVGAEEAGSFIRSLMSYRFDCKQFTTAEAVAYVEDMGLTDMVVSYAETGSIILAKTSRSDSDPEIDFRVVIDNGVLAECVTSTATTTRSDDVLAVTVVSEEPNPSDMTYFGRWGWYANTLENALADKEYSQKVDNAIDLLYDVLRNIMMWQYEFSAAEVKKLMGESLDYAKMYFGQLLDALPTPTQRSDNLRGNNMALSKEDKLEMAQLVATAIAEENAKRSDQEAKAKEAEERKRADDQAALKAKEQAEEIVRLRTDIETLKKGGVVTERSDVTDPVIDGDTTVVDDPEAKPVEKVKRSDKAEETTNVFQGIFGDLSVEGDE